MAESSAPAPEAGIDEAGFAKSAGRQLLLYALIAVVALTLLMVVLDALASLVGSDTGSNKAVDPIANSVTIAIRDEPPQLDSTLQTDTISGMVLAHAIEGLLKRDPQGNLVPAVAERWEIEPERATFWLREDSMWSNGEPVTAHDFVFAWRRAVDPATASEYAFIMFYVKNGAAINRGEMPLEALGVRADGDRKLVVDLERPTAFFDKLMAFPTYFPINETFFDQTKGRYGADAHELIYNGPFKITSWVHGASLLLEKNETYWDAENTRLDAVNVGYITQDGNALLNFFKDEKIAFAEIKPEVVHEALQQRWHISGFQDGSVFFFEFNHRPERLTRSLHLRRAFQLVVDSGEIVNKVIKLPGYLPGRSLFPVYLQGAEKKLRQEYPAPEPSIDVAEARRQLQLALDELGLESMPSITLLSGDTPVSNVVAEYFQRVCKEALGIDIKIDKQIFKQRIDKMNRGEFDIVLAGWGPDYDDALTFGDLFASWNLNNRGRYESTEYDDNVAIAQSSLDLAERARAFSELQRLVHEDVVIVPIYERGISYVTHPQLKGFVRRAVGANADFRYAYIDADAQ